MAKKKPTKKRIISKTEKKLKNQRRYQVEKRNKVRKDLNEAIKSLEKLKPEKKGKNLIYTIPSKIKKQLGIKRKTYKATKQTLINAYYQKIYKINNIIDDKEQKLIKRFKFKQKGAKSSEKRKKNELIFELGFVWNIDENVPNVILKNKIVKSVNGFSVKKQMNSVLNAIADEKSTMSSNNYMYIIGKPNEDFRIFIENLK